MIQPNELRLGNYVAVKNHGNKVMGKVFAINGELVSVGGGNNNYHYDLLEPIQITEEILIQCGFEKEIIKHYCGDYNVFVLSDEMYLHQDGHCYKWGIEDEVNGCGADAELIFLHQLMNLYFALTGKELEVKL